MTPTLKIEDSAPDPDDPGLFTTYHVDAKHVIYDKIIK